MCSSEAGVGSARSLRSSSSSVVEGGVLGCAAVCSGMDMLAGLDVGLAAAAASGDVRGLILWCLPGMMSRPLVWGNGEVVLVCE